MWQPRVKSTTLRARSTSSFSCSSFKDIQFLISDEDAYRPTSAAKRLPSIFHRVRVASALLRNWPSRQPEPEPEPQKQQPDDPPSPPPPSKTEIQPPVPEISLPGAEKRIVVYYTSLRVVRPTFEQCKEVLTILQGFRVYVDERDLSMDSSFLHEIQRILGGRDRLTLPRVFIGGRYVGGADEIRQLHEAGELKKVVQGYPVVKSGVCGTCGGHRFILCDECSGSHKLYSGKGGAAGFRTCTSCNENGLIRCPSCSCPSDLVDLTD